MQRSALILLFSFLCKLTALLNVIQCYGLTPPAPIYVLISKWISQPTFLSLIFLSLINCLCTSPINHLVAISKWIPMGTAHSLPHLKGLQLQSLSYWAKILTVIIVSTFLSYIQDLFLTWIKILSSCTSVTVIVS